MHLLFNQLVVTATRPILLHIFRTRLNAKETATPASVPEFESALSNACVQCARYSFQILTDAWLRGTFMTFDYFYTQYLFSAATVLAISSLFDDQDGRADRDSFDTAVQFVTQLRDSGNFAAAEFGQHMDAMTSLFASVQARTQSQRSDAPSPQASEGDGFPSGPRSDAAAGMQGFAADGVFADSLSSSLLAEPALTLNLSMRLWTPTLPWDSTGLTSVKSWLSI
jgi:proline utilization trans-activator